MSIAVQPYDVIVIGAGAAGLMAAGRVAERGRRVLLLEKNTAPGKKLSTSGGGRCNITNAETDPKALLTHYGSAEQFLYSTFAQFGVKETMQFFEAQAVPLKVEDRKRAFPVSNHAPDVVRALTAYVRQGKAEVRLGAAVTQVHLEEGKVAGVVAGGTEYVGTSYIFAAGGLSHPETGSTGDGFTWLRDLGHTIKNPTPTIVPLKVKDAWVKELSGKLLPHVKITFYAGDTKAFTKTGDILLTHFGLSGPTILNCAGAVADLFHVGSVTAAIDLFPTFNIGELDKKLQLHIDANKNKMLKNVASEFLPPGTAERLLALVPSVDPQKKVHSLTKTERRLLVDTFKALPVTILGLMGYDRAVVADGGVPLSEIDMRTMRSKKASNVFVVGDLLHVKRPSGGYSLQLCWTTGYVAGSYA